MNMYIHPWPRCCEATHATSPTLTLTLTLLYAHGQVLRGDPCDLANPLMRAGRATSFDPFEDESSRIVAAAAAVYALTHSAAVELTVSAASGEVPPTQAEWAELFEQL